MVDAHDTGQRDSLSATVPVHVGDGKERVKVSCSILNTAVVPVRPNGAT